MKLNVYAIYDQQAKAYLQPFFMNNDGQALRAFIDNVNAEKLDSQIANHPEDFTLFKIGSYDDSNGALVSSGVLQKLMNGVEAKVPKVVVSGRQVDAFEDELKEVNLRLERVLSSLGCIVEEKEGIDEPNE